MRWIALELLDGEDLQKTKQILPDRLADSFSDRVAGYQPELHVPGRKFCTMSSRSGIFSADACAQSRVRRSPDFNFPSPYSGG